MVSMLASIVVDFGLDHRPAEPKTLKFVFCCFFAKGVSLRSKSKDG
jgi:hypothetical protein